MLPAVRGVLRPGQVGTRERWDRPAHTLITSVATQVPKPGCGSAHFAQLLLLAVLRTTLPPLPRGGPTTPRSPPPP